MTGRIPQDFIQDLVNRVDIVEIIDSRVQLKKIGHRFLAICPFHTEKTPSFQVDANKQLFYCFGCQISGNVIGFLMEYDRLTFVETIEQLATKAGLDIPYKPESRKEIHPNTDKLYDILERVSHYYQQQLRHHHEGKNAINYLQQRGLTGKTAQQFAIGFAPSGWQNILTYFQQHSQNTQATIPLLKTAGMLVEKENGGCYDRFRHRIMFPIRDHRGRIIGFGGRCLTDEQPKYLNSPETPIFHKNTSLYGLYETLQTTRKIPFFIVVEGYMDVIALMQHGINYAVATLGTAPSQAHVKLLFRYSSHLIFCFDGDDAGKTAAWRALNQCLPILRDDIQIQFMFLPEQEDPDSMINQEGKDNFMHRIEQSLPLSEYFCKYLQQQVNPHTLEGRSHIAKQAASLLNKIPKNSIFFQMLLDKIANLVNMSGQQLRKFIHSSPASTRKTYAQTRAQNLPPSSIRTVIMLLFQQPKFIKHIDDHKFIQQLEHPEAHILHQLITIIDQDPNCITATLLEHWRHQDNFSHIQQLACTLLPISEDGLEKEFIGAWNCLKQQHLQQQIDNLLTRTNDQPLNREERQLLVKLIKKKKNVTIH